VVPDVTIHLSFGQGSAVTSREVNERAAAAEATTPMALGDLQAFGTGIAPAPQSAAELTRATETTSVAVGENPPPTPLPYESLVAVSSGGAPVPMDLGFLASGGTGPSAPQPLALLGGDSTEVPGPMDAEQLGLPNSKRK